MQAWQRGLWIAGYSRLVSTDANKVTAPARTAVSAEAVVVLLGSTRAGGCIEHSSNFSTACDLFVQSQSISLSRVSNIDHGGGTW